MPHPVTQSIALGDGTTLASHRSGDGPGLVLLHGTASSSIHQRELASRLATRHTVHALDRRGRGDSGSVKWPPTLDQEAEDLRAVMTATGASDVAGVSSGAIVCLEAARRDPRIERVVAFEPPLIPDLDQARSITDRFDAELQAGRVNAALVTAMLGAEMGSVLMRRLPRPVLTSLVGFMADRPQGQYPSMATLAPAIGWDLRLAAEAAGSVDRWADVRQPVLLLGGDRSPAFLRRALVALAGVLPGARRVELPGLDHVAPWNRDLRGAPEAVADAMLTFLGGH